MAKLNMNCDKVKAYASELNSIAEDYNKIIDDLYTSLMSVSKDGIWMSESSNGSANKFIDAVSKDKENVIKLASNMHSLGNRINNYANFIKLVMEIGVNK